jgi:hypothetical protein
MNDQARLLAAHERRAWWFAREKSEANAQHRAEWKP